MAIGAESPRTLADFYSQIPGLWIEKEFLYEGSDRLRSVWVRVGDLRIMLEEGRKKAPRALVFNMGNKQDWNQFLKLVEIINKTEYTAYFLDPEGNRLGVSTYPKPLSLGIV